MFSRGSIVSLGKDWEVGILFHTNTFDDKTVVGKILPGETAIVLQQIDLWAQVLTTSRHIGWIYANKIQSWNLDGEEEHEPK
jgi:hypothetical protein